MKKKWVHFSATIKLLFRGGKNQSGPIRWGLMWELLRHELIHEAQEVSLNPWMIVVKTNREIQTILEKRMPLSEAEGEALKDLLVEILPGFVLDKQVNDTQGNEMLSWSHTINKTHA